MPWNLSRSWLLHLVVVTAAVTGCTPAVKLTLRNGATYSGTPVSNDETHVVIQTAHARYLVCKRDVADADHAGNGLAITGAALAAVGIAAIAAAVALTPSHPTDRNGPGVAALFAIPGAGLVVTGIVLGSAGFAQWSAGANATGLPARPDVQSKPCKPPVVARRLTP